MEKNLKNNQPKEDEFSKLVHLLTDDGIPFELKWRLGGRQLIYPNREIWVCDVICNPGSYGYENGLLEIMGLVEIDGDTVEGWLTAEEVFERIKNHYKKDFNKGD